MKSEELQIDILKRQNREMAIRMQNYRVENQELKAKNQELNTWVGNLSEVFSTVSASWESITILEQTLLNLMKKKTEAKDRTLLRKYQFHFKTFADIINNLSDKIKNPGHSEQATLDAKEQLRSFVKNYELIFKELLETYFKFNQQYSLYLTELKNREDVKEQVRTVLSKSFESTQKIKEFEGYFQELNKKLHTFQEFNNNKLLEGVVKKKEDEIQALKERNNILQRRIKVIFDYNANSVDLQLSSNQNSYECVCGGAQLNYMKKAWQQKLRTNGTNLQLNQNQEQINGVKNESTEALAQKLLQIEGEKSNLIQRNTLLLDKISKMSTQYKLTDQMVLKSNVYCILKQQCQYLMDYVTELLAKLKKQQEFLALIERARDDELKDLKKKLDKKPYEDRNGGGVYFNNSNDIFKTQVTTYIKQLLSSFQQLNKKQLKYQQPLKQFKDSFQQLKKSNEELNRKVNDLQAKELAKTDGPEFKYQKYKELEVHAHSLLQKQMPNQLDLWKEFINHVKSRDKKLKDLQSVLRKKEKEIVQKTQIEEMMRGSLTETERIYIENKQKLNKTEAFMKKIEAEIIKLSDQNLKIQNNAQQDRNLLSLRLKAQTQARNKLEERILVLGKIQAQFTQITENQARMQKDYDIWLESHKRLLQQARRECQEKQLAIKNLTESSNEVLKSLQKSQSQKQKFLSQIRQLKTRIDKMNSTTQNQLLKVQLQEYKGKIMCSCTGDRQREVVLKTCPHLFCKRCIEDTTNNRNRKCPMCGIRFTKTDVHQIKWN